MGAPAVPAAPRVEPSPARLDLRRLAQIELPMGQTWLSAGERERLASFGATRRRETFLAGRWLLRELLAAELGGAAEAHALEIDAEGRSRAAVGHVNVSHSGDWCVAAWSDAPVGVDIEVLRPRTDLMAVAERVASERECVQLAATEESGRLQAFYRLWTLKEACLKSQGRGLDFALMRELEFESCSSTEGDTACAQFATAGLQLAVCSVGLGALPERLADELLSWQRFRKLTP